MKRFPLTSVGAAALVALKLGSASAQDIEPSDMVRGGLQAMQLIDQNRTGELWTNASAGAKTQVSAASFSADVGKARAALGAPRERVWTNVSRLTMKNPDPAIAGTYVNVEYQTRFTNRPDATVQEMVSFHLDRDGVWRFSGYVLR